MRSTPPARVSPEKASGYAGVFDAYWKHRAAKEAAAKLPRPVLRSFEAFAFDETETLYWRNCHSCGRILDIGAGDNRVRRKFLEHGYAGKYETYDVSREFEHDYYSLDDVSGSYDAILLLEVVEHMPLEQFSALMKRVEEHLSEGGVIVVSTPNPACINSMWAGDMTHVQQYPLNDLLAFFISRGFSCEGYRVLYTSARLGLGERLRLFLKKIIVTKIIGADYADGLIVVARKAAL